MVAIDWKKATLPFISMIRPSWQKYAPTGASLLLLVILGYNLAQFTWVLLPTVAQQKYIDTNRVISVADQSVASATAQVDIARWHLFGRADAVVVAPPKQDVVPETKLRLELKGILASSDPRFARAIILEPPRNEETYKVDATLPGGATLLEINSDHIVLLRQGQREKLLLPREGMQTSDGGAAVSPQVSAGAQDEFVSSPRAGSGAATVASSRLSELRTVLNNDPQSLMGLINAKPEIVDGQIAGFKLDGNQNDQLMRRFGLRQGDVVTAVNDMRLDASVNLPELLNVLKTADQVKIEYSRRGRPRSVVLNMDE